jgi:3-hydroxymyristoyl/3-hydroxydecanoyl-(acyl carrier protein) dehydratase
VLFRSINNVKFRKQVTPGDQLVFHLDMISRKNKVCVMSGKAYVDGILVAEAELTAAITDKNAPLEK